MRLLAFLICTIFLSPLTASAAKLDDAFKAYNDFKFKRAFQIFSDLAQKGNMRALFYVAKMQAGKTYGGVSHDIVKFRENVSKAARKGDQLAQVQMAARYYFGHGPYAKNDYLAAEWYQRAIDQGKLKRSADEIGKFITGYLVRFVEVHTFLDRRVDGAFIPNSNSSKLGVHKNSDYWALYDLATAGKDGEAAFKLGILTEGNSALSIKWYTVAASRNHAEAQTALGHAYVHGRGGATINKELGAQFYALGAANGSKSAQEQLAILKRQQARKEQQRAALNTLLGIAGKLIMNAPNQGAAGGRSNTPGYRGDCPSCPLVDPLEYLWVQ